MIRDIITALIIYDVLKGLFEILWALIIATVRGGK